MRDLRRLILDWPRYASPEQLQGKACGVPGDVYAWALVMFELYAGHRPYPTEWREDKLREQIVQRGYRPQLRGSASSSADGVLTDDIR